MICKQNLKTFRSFRELVLYMKIKLVLSHLWIESLKNWEEKWKLKMGGFKNLKKVWIKEKFSIMIRDSKRNNKMTLSIKEASVKRIREELSHLLWQLNKVRRCYIFNLSKWKTMISIQRNYKLKLLNKEFILISPIII